jgi:WD40 repeat protein
MSASGDYRTHMYDPKIGLPPVSTSHSSTIQGSNNIWDIAVSSDGRLIASGDDNGVVQIWDSRSHKPIGKPGKHGVV